MSSSSSLAGASVGELCRMMSGRRELENSQDAHFVSLVCGGGGSGQVSDRARLRVCGQAALRLESGELGADTVIGNLYAKSFDDALSMCGANAIESSLRRVRVPLEDDLERFTKRACESLLVGSPDSELYASLCTSKKGMSADL